MGFSNKNNEGVNMEDIFSEVLEEMENPFSEAEEVKQRFTITDDKTADWAFRAIREEDAEYERIAADIKEQLDYFNERLEKVQKRHDNRRAILLSLLREYFDRVPHKSTKTQESYEIASGKIVLKKKEPKTTVDDKTLGEWMNYNGIDFVEFVPKVNWSGFKKTLHRDGLKWFMDDGTEVQGLTVTEQEPTFDIK